MEKKKRCTLTAVAHAKEDLPHGDVLKEKAIEHAHRKCPLSASPQTRE